MLALFIKITVNKYDKMIFWQRMKFQIFFKIPGSCSTWFSLKIIQAALLSRASSSLVYYQSTWLDHVMFMSVNKGRRCLFCPDILTRHFDISEMTGDSERNWVHLIYIIYHYMRLARQHWYWRSSWNFDLCYQSRDNNKCKLKSSNLSFNLQNGCHISAQSRSDLPQMGQIWDSFRSDSIHFGLLSQNILNLIWK